MQPPRAWLKDGPTLSIRARGDREGVDRTGQALYLCHDGAVRGADFVADRTAAIIELNLASSLGHIEEELGVGAHRSHLVVQQDGPRLVGRPPHTGGGPAGRWRVIQLVQPRPGYLELKRMPLVVVGD